MNTCEQTAFFNENYDLLNSGKYGFGKKIYIGCKDSKNADFVAKKKPKLLSKINHRLFLSFWATINLFFWMNVMSATSNFQKTWKITSINSQSPTELSHIQKGKEKFLHIKVKMNSAESLPEKRLKSSFGINREAICSQTKLRAQ